MNLNFLHLTSFNVTFHFFHVRIWIHLARQLQVQMDPNSLEIKVQQHKIITSRKKGSRCYLMVGLYKICQRYYRIHFFALSLKIKLLCSSYPGRVTNIPQGMVTDQFGMIGLLTFIRAAETDPGMVHLALGSDLTTLGLNLNSPE